MRVVALASFVGKVGGDTLLVTRGKEFDLPDGVDWLRAGLVAPTAPAPHLVGVEHAIDTDVLTAERRVFGGMLLSGIDGIGPRTAAKLADARLETVDDLLAADPAAVAAATGASPATVLKWRQRAEAATQ
jgi:hypothetical protein